MLGGSDDISEESKGTTIPEKNPFDEEITFLNKTLGGSSDTIKEITTGLVGANSVLGKMLTMTYDLAGEFFKIENVTFKTFDQFGVGSIHAESLKENLFEAGQELMEFSKTQMDPLEAMKKAADMQEAYSKSFHRNIFLSKENIVNIGKASELTNVSTKTLIETFVGLGRNVENIGATMETVARTVTSLGMNVAGVSDTVVKYIGKLDTFNFKEGVGGLAKMVGESAKLGINMDKVFDKTEQLLNPEAAIEFAATIQRLGFANSELADATSVMNMAENPEKFAKAIDEITKGLAEYDRETGEAKLNISMRDLRVTAEALGQDKEAFANTIKRRAMLDAMREDLKKNPFTTFSEKDIKLIEGLATQKDGGFVVKIKDETGEEKEKRVDELKADDFKKLEEQMTMQNKTTDNVLKEQMTSSELMNSTLSTMDASLNSLVVLNKEANALSREYRDSYKTGGGMQNVNQTLRETGKELRNTELKDIPTKATEKGQEMVNKIKDMFSGTPTTITPSSDFIYREDGGVLNFERGDLVLGLNENKLESFLSNKPPTTNNLQPLQNTNITEKMTPKESTNTEVKIPISGKLDLNLNITSDKGLDKKTIEDFLSKTETIDMIKKGIKNTDILFNAVG